MTRITCLWRCRLVAGIVTLSTLVLGCATTPNPSVSPEKTAPVAATMAPDASLPGLLNGDFNNYLQVWQQKVDEVDVPFGNLQLSFQAIAVAEQTEGVLLARRQTIGQPELTVRRVLVTDDPSQPMTQRAYLLPDAATPPLRLATLVRDPGCDLIWRQGGSGVVLGDSAADCDLTRDFTALRLTATDLTATRDGVDWRFKKARQFKGWMGVKKQRWDDTAADDDWVFMSKIAIHNEGQTVRLVDKDGTPTGFAIQLERLVYQNTRTPVLKLGLIDEKTRKTITYTWSEPGSKLLGMNLRWFQVGLTALDE